MTLCRKTARRGRRRWLAWPTRRALVLVAIIVGMWLASGWWCVYICNGRTFEVLCERGRLGVLHDGGGTLGWSMLSRMSTSELFWIYRAAAFHLDLDCRVYFKAYPRPAYGPFAFQLDLPLITVVAPLVGAILLWSMWRRQPFPTGHCAFCGYDLRGTTSGRCPECGVSVGSSPGQRVCGPML